MCSLLKLLTISHVFPPSRALPQVQHPSKKKLDHYPRRWLIWYPNSEPASVSFWNERANECPNDESIFFTSSPQAHHSRDALFCTSFEVRAVMRGGNLVLAILRGQLPATRTPRTNRRTLNADLGFRFRHHSWKAQSYFLSMFWWAVWSWCFFVSDKPNHASVSACVFRELIILSNLWILLLVLQ